MPVSAQPQAVLKNCGLILVRPKYPENIGAAARIACNFGFGEITVVADEPPEQERMLKMATHKAAPMIEQLCLVSSSSEAASSYQFIVGATARQRKHRNEDCGTPQEVMTELGRFVAAGSRAALMFGPENTGLTNEDIDLCQFTCTIPTADFSSLNLAQAVAIHSYELFMAAGRTRAASGGGSYANSYELEGMYEHIEQTLDRIGLLRPTSRNHWMRSIRQFFSRTTIKKKEASLIRGVCRKFLQQSGGPGWLPPQRPEPPSD